jgi:predicted CXXCH cytochrome family protein
MHSRCGMMLAILIAAIVLIYPIPAAAAPPADESAPQSDLFPSCLGCHSAPGLETTLASGERLLLTVDPAAIAASVHGRIGLTCTDCHIDIIGFPHPPLTAQTQREFTLQIYPACATCHEGEFSDTVHGVHGKALAEGNTEAAVCTDCHGAHDIQPPAKPRSLIPQTCAQCHSEIFALYKESVHGRPLLEEENSDVPSCTDCHGVHLIQGPSESGFRVRSPQICAGCHTDTEMMGRYGISTDVLSTYVADFHGTTVTLFEEIAPNLETNKAVCVDCHGVHDILPPNDPNSTIMKENLLATCQKCHPDATANFPTAWLGHYIPSPEHSPIVYYVTQFYKFFIPLVLGGLGFLVITDASRRFFKHRKERRDE